MIHYTISFGICTSICIRMNARFTKMCESCSICTMQRNTDFKAVYLLDPAYLFRRVRSIRSWRDLAGRFVDLGILTGKILTGRYGEKYWAKLKKEQFDNYESNKDTIRDNTVHLNAGRRYLQKEEYDKALAAFTKVLSADPQNEFVIFELGNLYLKLGDETRAAAKYRESAGINPLFILPKIELAKIHCGRGDFDLAEKEFRQALEDFPGDPRILGELGRIYRLFRPNASRDDLASLARNMEAALKTPGSRLEHYWELGKLQRDGGDANASAKTFAKLLKLPEVASDRFLWNKTLNELEITRRLTVLESRPRAMIAMITNKCNIQCRICEIWKSDWQESDRTMREIAGMLPYMEDICWQGGEVFMMKGFTDLLKEASRYPNLKQVIFTNGLMLNEKILEMLSAGRADIVFSIDGTSKETYEYIRRGGNFERLKKALSLVREFKRRDGSGIKTYLNPVIMRTNYRELESFVDFAREYGFNALTFTPIRGDFGNENIFDTRDAEALGHIGTAMPAVVAKARRYGLRLNNWLPVECADAMTGVSRPGGADFTACAEPGRPDDIELLKAMLPMSQGSEARRDVSGGQAAAGPAWEAPKASYDDIGPLSFETKMVCHAPWQRLLLDSLGNVRPFAFCSTWVGSTEKSSLAGIWNGEGMQEYRRRLSHGDCSGLCRPECISGQVRDKICEIS